MSIILYISAAFLITYGSVALKLSFKTHPIGRLAKTITPRSLKRTLILASALLIFNPGLFLEAVIVIGGIGGQLTLHAQQLFLIGACIGTFTWYFGLGYGCTKLSRFFTKDSTWKVLEVIAATIMFITAFILIRMALKLDAIIFI